MEVFEDALSRRDLPRELAATIGNYDGVHRGQQATLERVVAAAADGGLASAVITFDPHPLAVLAPNEAPRRLTSRDQKIALLEASGVDAMIEVRFDRDFAATRAETFVRDFLVGRLAVRRLWVGRRFTFGWRKQGDLELLRRLGESLGFEAAGQPEIEHGGAPISSSRIRRAVAAGDVREAAAMLGRPFALHGTIVEGQRRGRGLGWPTINLEPEQNAIPARGVYVSEVRFDGESEWRGSVTNIGVRPTVTAGVDEVVESHLLDFSREVYGMRAEVAFVDRLRDERTFPDVDALVHQITQDVEAARRFFAADND